VEILNWYHADEHISAVARTLYGEGTEQAAAWRHAQLDRLATDQVDAVIEGLRFLGSHQRRAAQREAVASLARYLTTNRARMRYQTFRAAGYVIGSGAVESAVSHVFQQRMKRVGMRWRAAGARVRRARPRQPSAPVCWPNGRGNSRGKAASTRGSMAARCERPAPSTGAIRRLCWRLSAAPERAR
jgi:hypothetical protein